MIIEAITNLRPTSVFTLMGDTYDTLIWQDQYTTAPTEEEVNIEIARLEAQQPLNDCKSKAVQILNETDWASIGDVGDPAKSNPYLVNQSEFIAYRSTIRNYAVNPIADPVWPTQPTEQWSN